MKDEALKLALEILNAAYVPADLDKQREKAITAIKQALAAPVQKRPPNCGTGYCSCVECVMEPTPVQADAWPCVIAEADFEQNTVTLEMQCSDYKVGAGQHWLHTTPPAAPDLQAELDATNRQVEILSDALAESRREVARLKAVQEPAAWEDVLGAIARGWTHPENAQKPMDVQLAVAIAKEIQDMYTTQPAAQRQHVTDGSLCWCDPETSYTDPETGASVIVHKGPQ
jgi:hypothetical protein